MSSAYFDTNVYISIAEGRLHADEVEALRVALARREVVAHPSIADIEELLGRWETDRPAAVRKLRIVRDLVGFDNMLKQPADLLSDAIRAYAAGTTPPPPAFARKERRFLASELNKIAEERASLGHTVSQIIADVKKMKEAFRRGMKEAGDQVLAELRLEPRVRRQVSFEEFWTDATQWAEAFAADVGLADACRERGLDGLLEVRTVRLYVGAAKSLVYSQMVEGRQPDFSDGYDLWHAILASVADVFLTFDKRLAEHVARVPVDGFRVITSLRELLDLL